MGIWTLYLTGTIKRTEDAYVTIILSRSIPVISHGLYCLVVNTSNYKVNAPLSNHNCYGAGSLRMQNAM